MKTLFNLDRVRICLLQPEGFYEALYYQYHGTPVDGTSEDSTPKDSTPKDGVLRYDGYYLSFADKEHVNDIDIIAKLFLDVKPAVELGTFTFNRSRKYRSKYGSKCFFKCFFEFATKSLYDVAGYQMGGHGQAQKYNYFVFPFSVFDDLGLVFNNVSSVEIACDTEASVISRILYAVGHPEVFDMVLLWTKIKDPDEILEGFYEFHQRSRLKKAPRPTLYIRPAHYERGDNASLTVYDKARELAQSRPDKDVLTRAWNGMGDDIQRLEISVENKQFNRFFQLACKSYPNRWLVRSGTASTQEQKWEEYKQGLEHFFWDLGQDEDIKEAMFDYFSNHLLHFKLKDHDKTQVSILDLTVNSLTELKGLAKRKRKPRGASAK